MADQSFNPFEGPVTTQQIATALLAPFFAGWMAHFVLCGIVCARFSSYVGSALYARDELSTKVTIWALLLIDLSSAGIHGSNFIFRATSQDRSFYEMIVAREADAVATFLVGVSAALYSSFMCRRAAKLFKSNLTGQSAFVWCMHALIAVAFAAETACFVLLLLQDYTHVNGLTAAWLWLNTAVDWIITGALFFQLRRRFEQGHPWAVQRLIRISIQTAAYTSLCTLAGAVLVVVAPSGVMSSMEHAFLAFEIPLPSLHAISLLVTLASREEPVALVVGNLRHGLSVQSKLQPRLAEDDEDDDDEDDEEGEDEDEDSDREDVAKVRVQHVEGPAVHRLAVLTGGTVDKPCVGGDGPVARAAVEPALAPATAPSGLRRVSFAGERPAFV